MSSEESIASPLFILGASRSGTSIMGTMLSDVFGYAGENEGHIWTVFLDHLDRLDGQQEFILRGFPQDKAVTTFQRIGYQRIYDDLVSLYTSYIEECYGDTPWLDKTPAPQQIRRAPVLQKLFPSARFIFMKRHGIENVLSARRRFEGRDFDRDCQRWQVAMKHFIKVRDALDHVIVVDQADLVHKPQEVAERLRDFLGGTDAHVTACAEYLESNFPQMTSKPTADHHDLDSVDWTDEEKQQFADICGDMMDAYGYRFRPAAAPRTQAFNRWCAAPTNPLNEEIRLHPNEPEERQPQVIYPELDLNGAAALDLELNCNPNGAGANVEIALHSENAESVSKTIQVTPGQPHQAALTVPPGRGPVQLQIDVHNRDVDDNFRKCGVSIKLQPRYESG